MMSVERITYTAWAFDDLAKVKRNHGKFTPEELKKLLLRRYPNYLDFMAYCFGFLGLLGPVPNIEDYLDFVDQKVKK